MPRRSRVSEIIERMMESRETPEEACAECPELLPSVRQRWSQLNGVEAKLETFFPSPNSNGTSKPLRPAQKRPEIAGYDIGEILGRGAVGVVYKARYLKLNRYVALKMLLSGIYASATELKRFMREAESVASLRHTNFVQVYEVGDLDGVPYFTMEFVEGGTLSQKLNGVPLPSKQAAALTKTLAEAMQAAHTSGIIHRDLKPSNILLTSEGIPKISDFGLARRIEATSDLTHSGDRIGTPCYMAPEQAKGRGNTVGPLADVYSLGAILYELLTGRPPFQGETPGDTERQLLTIAPVPPSRLNAKVPRDLETICLKCLQKETARRYGSAAALVEDLNRFFAGMPISARPVGPAERAFKWARRHPVFVTTSSALAIAAMVLLGAAFWFISQRAANERAALQDLDEAIRFEKHSSWSQADAALDRAEIRLGNRGIGAPRRQLEQARRDSAIARRLDTIRMERAESIGGLLDTKQVDRDYSDAFRDAGFGTDADSSQTVGERIRRSNIQSALIDALDDWSTSKTSGERRSWILQVAECADTGMDPHKWRDRIRKAIVLQTRELLVEEAGKAPVDLLASEPVSFLLALDMELRIPSEQPDPLLAKTLETHPSDFYALMAMGERARLTNDSEAELGYFQAAEALRPDVMISHHNFGMALVRAGRIDEGIIQYRQALKCDPKSSETHDGLGLALMHTGDLEEGIAELRESIRLASEDTRHFYNLATALSVAGRYSESLDVLKTALAKQPVGQMASLARTSMGLALVHMGRFDEAEEQMKEGVRLDPENIESRVELAACQSGAGRQTDALNTLQQTLALKPTGKELSRTQYFIGLANLRLGNAEEALHAFELAIQASPNDPDYRYELGMALGTVGRNAEAVDAFRTALAMHPTGDLLAHTRINLGIMLLKLNRLDDAIELKVNDANFLVNLGIVLCNADRNADAVEAFQQAVSLKPTGETETKAQYGLGKAFIRAERMEDAASAWREALDFNPLDQTTCENYASLCAYLGRDTDFQHARKVMLDSFGNSSDPHVCETVARACLFMPGSPEEIRKASEMIDRALASEQSTTGGFTAYYHFAKGLAEYRAGHFESTVNLLKGDASRVLGPAPGLVAAMAQYRLGQTDQAVRTFDRAVLGYDWGLPERKRERMYFVFRSEAEQVILPNLPAFLLGKYQPKDNAERIALTGICQSKHLDMALAKLWTDAFAADPALADKYRYNAATAAALAACGQGDDSKQCTGDDRIRLSRQAAQWLNNDLDMCEKQLQGDSLAINNAKATLSRWASSSDLAGVRGSASLALMPADQHKQWESTWARLAAMQEHDR